jgi:hypothetical protein
MFVAKEVENNHRHMGCVFSFTPRGSVMKTIMHAWVDVERFVEDHILFSIFSFLVKGFLFFKLLFCLIGFDSTSEQRRGQQDDVSGGLGIEEDRRGRRRSSAM